MQESNVRQEIYRSLRLMGLWPITQTDAARCPQCGGLTYPPKGRPDILVLNPTGRSYVIEVKTFCPEQQKSFPFSRIEDKQRKWLTRWAEDKGKGFLAIGTINVRPRSLWLIPWEKWLEIERLCLKYQKSLPYQVGRGYNKGLQDNLIDFRLLDEWKAEWKGKGIWKLKL